MNVEENALLRDEIHRLRRANIRLEEQLLDYHSDVTVITIRDSDEESEDFME
ncbi:hypothetical protein PINS_up017256 [Pythium insidiosum]|nr:hypothetical protein PINS_up017256 [Pythium insidiosum]